MGAYRSLFIIPLNSEKVLTDDGWEFVSENRIPPETMAVLRSTMGLEFEEAYLGIESYRNAELQAVVSYDGSGGIEHVHIKIYGNCLGVFISAFSKANISGAAEIFIP